VVPPNPREAERDLLIELDRLRNAELKTEAKADNLQTTLDTELRLKAEADIAHSERVKAAMQQIMSSRSWTDPQRKWLERIGKQLEQETIVDREALDTGQFKEFGGFNRLN